MNERIKDLLIKAGVINNNFNPLAYEQWYLDSLEKFAELIVGEYEKLLPEVCPWVDADKEGPMKGWHVQFVARKHFGVEE